MDAVSVGAVVSLFTVCREAPGFIYLTQSLQCVSLQISSGKADFKQN